MSGQYHVELRRRSLRYYTMESRFTPESGHVQCTSSCLLWANSGPVRSRVEASIVQKSVSALLPKADMCGALAHVCFVPIADMRSYKCEAASLS